MSYLRKPQLASHGAGILALALFVWMCVWAPHLSFLQEGKWQIPAMVAWGAMILIGLLMLVTGWKAAQTALDGYGSHVGMWCMVKLALAVAVWAVLFDYDKFEFLPLDVRAILAFLPARWLIMGITIWLVTTALVSLMGRLASARRYGRSPARSG